MTGPAVVVIGADPYGLGEELEALGAAVTRVTAPVSGETLDDAGIADAAIVVVTEMSEAASLAVATERNPAVRAVTYAERSLPAYAARVTDLALDPDLLSPAVVAEELLGDSADD